MWQQIAFAMYLFLEIKKKKKKTIQALVGISHNVKIQEQFRGCESGVMGVPCMTG